jgi:hypothetical protein
MIKKPVNPNYCGVVVRIKNIIDLDGCDNIKATTIFGNNVIIGKDVVVGQLGVYFPVETSLSKEFLYNNNLYRDSTLNKDSNKRGYFDLNGRIRAVKLRGNKSDGLFLGIHCIDFAGSKIYLEEGMVFDELNEIKICEKYLPKEKPIVFNSKKNKRAKSNSIEIVENQFRFHYDTENIGRYIDRLKLADIISITSKIHGSSFVVSKVLCKRKLNLFERMLRGIGIQVQDSEYRNIYSSRRVIKNVIESKDKNHYYNEDIWGVVNNELKDYLIDGMSIYGEVSGYLSDGGYIQKDYDYGCDKGKHRIDIYRITMTNNDGYVFEFSAKQVQDWCKERGLSAVPQLYYGYVVDLYDILCKKYNNLDGMLGYNKELFLGLLSSEYLEKDLEINKSCKVPDEGVVVRIEKNELEAYKLKSFAFKERESKSSESNIEDGN